MPCNASSPARFCRFQLPIFYRCFSKRPMTVVWFLDSQFNNSVAVASPCHVIPRRLFGFSVLQSKLQDAVLDSSCGDPNCLPKRKTLGTAPLSGRPGTTTELSRKLRHGFLVIYSKKQGGGLSSEDLALRL